MENQDHDRVWIEISKPLWWSFRECRHLKHGDIHETLLDACWFSWINTRRIFMHALQKAFKVEDIFISLHGNVTSKIKFQFQVGILQRASEQPATKLCASHSHSNDEECVGFIASDKAY
jgi:hypothetical protein